MVAVVVALLVVVAAAAFAVVAYRRDWRWTGLPADPGDGTPAAPPRPAKTLWDWLQLLIVPLILAVAAYWLNSAQVARERDSAEDRAREEALRTYLQQMSDLMTRGDATVDTQTLAQTLTLVTLRRLDGVRKGLVVQFLIEANMISRPVYPARPLVVAGLDIPGPLRACGNRGQPSCRRSRVSVNLSGADLRGAVMSSAGSASLPEGFVVGPGGRLLEGGPSFVGADLRNADFHGLLLSHVWFDGADLRGANFSDANLHSTSFVSTCLSKARLDGVVVDGPADFSYTQGRGVDFSNARLGKANFADARLTDVRLSGASTTGVRWPRDWTPTGLLMSDAEARELCQDRRP